MIKAADFARIRTPIFLATVWPAWYIVPITDGALLAAYCSAALGIQADGREGGCMTELIRRMWCEEQGQDIAEYAVMLAVILVLVIGTIRLVGTNANNAFSSVASSIQ